MWDLSFVEIQSRTLRCCAVYIFSLTQKCRSCRRCCGATQRTAVLANADIRPARDARLQQLYSADLIGLTYSLIGNYRMHWLLRTKSIVEGLTSAAIEMAPHAANI